MKWIPKKFFFQNLKHFLSAFSECDKNTLSGYIGSSTSDRSGSVDNQSTVSSGNASENGDSKRSSSIASEGEKPAPKHCPICKKAFTKVYLKFRY